MGAKAIRNIVTVGLSVTDMIALLAISGKVSR
jgi:hypothetical protein